MAFGSSGVGDQVVDNQLGFSPDTALQAAIVAAVDADTSFLGWYVKIDITANRTVSLCADTNKPEAEIIDALEISKDVHILTLRFYGYSDKEDNWHSGTPSYVVKSYRAGASIALGQEVRVEGADYKYIEGVDSAGIGKVIYLDTTNEKAGFLY